VKWRAIALRDRYGHRRAVYETDQGFRGIQFKVLNDTVFNSMGSWDALLDVTVCRERLDVIPVAGVRREYYCARRFFAVSPLGTRERV
jgi:hypothetical protein